MSVLTSSRGRTATSLRPAVLVTDDTGGQSRSALAAVRALGTAGYAVTVAVSSASSMAASSRHCARRVHVPPVGSAGYSAALRAEVDAGGHVAVFPSSDRALIALGAPGATLVDKSHLARVARDAGLRTVGEQVLESGEALWAAASDIDYPVVVKPALKAPGAERPAGRVDGLQDLLPWRAVSAPLVVQPFLQGTMRATSGVMWGGRLLAVAHQSYVRTWPEPCGTACYARTTEPDPELEGRLEALLSQHNGVFQVQFIGQYLIDVNPRVYGSLPLAVTAGANLPAIAAAAATGAASPALVRARPGVRYRWLEGDVRNVVSGVRTGRLTPPEAVLALAPRRRTAHSVTALLDPLPVMPRVRHVLSRVGG